MLIIMNIGNVCIKNRSVLAPLAGAADRPFRLMVKKQGVHLMFSELISSDGLVYNSQRTQQLCVIHDDERPFGLQLFGSDPAVMEQAAVYAEQFKPDIIDLNFGCPVKKVVKRGAGSALMKDLERMRSIAGRVVQSVSVPVFAKIRSGWDTESVVAVEAAQLLEQEGVQAVTVHARTRSMGFSGKADWDVIRRVKEAVSVFVIGNGDVTGPHTAREMVETTGCDAVMVGRGAFGRPWIFRHIDRYLETGVIEPDPCACSIIDMCVEHFQKAVDMLGPGRGVKEMRKHIAWYVKGMRNSAGLRRDIFSYTDPEAVIARMQEFRNTLHGTC